MIYPTITNHDEWNFLDSLGDSEIVGFPNSDQGYYAHVVRYKYPQCRVKLTATTIQVLQPGISAVPIELNSDQRARQRLFDALDTPLQGKVTKDEWLRALRDTQLLPDPTFYP